MEKQEPWLQIHLRSVSLDEEATEEYKFTGFKITSLLWPVTHS